MYSFLKENSKILGRRRALTAGYHPASNGINERWHGSLHDGLSHYVNATHEFSRVGTIFPYGLSSYAKYYNIP